MGEAKHTLPCLSFNDEPDGFEGAFDGRIGPLDGADRALSVSRGSSPAGTAAQPCRSLSRSACVARVGR